MTKMRLFSSHAAAGLLLIALSGCSTTDAPPNASAVSAETASRTVEDGGTGSFKALMAADRTLPTHTVFRPKELGAFRRKAKLPIIAWGNGAFANSPWEHVNFLSEIASHGFLVVAIGPIPAEGQRGGPGGPTKAAMLTDTINLAIAQNSDKSSQYYHKLDVAKIAVAGMPCGGLQTLEVPPDRRITTVMICNSGIVQLDLPLRDAGVEGNDSPKSVAVKGDEKSTELL